MTAANANISSILEPHHLADLRKSGLTDETILKAGLHSENRLDVLSTMLCRKYQKRMQSALVFPFFSASGERLAFARAKPTSPRVEKKKPVKYESPVGQSNRAYFPPGIAESLQDPAAPLIITEGEKKSLAATQVGLATIGLVGVFGWKAKNDAKADTLLSDLDAIPWTGRKVYVAFDSDRSEKLGVLDAEYRLAVLLQSRGAIVRVVQLPSLPDGSKCGLDDFLVAFGPDALRMTLAAAVEPVAPNTANPLSRLEAVLATGPEALFHDEPILKALAVESIDEPPAYAAHRETLRNAGVKMLDFNRAIKRLVATEAKSRPPALARDETGGFFVSEGCLCRTKLLLDGPVTVQLANFTAEICDETIKDDGAETSIVIGVRGQLASGRLLPRVEVLAANFPFPEKWIVAAWGTDCIVWPGEAKCLSAAIQAVSKQKQRRTVYAHTGWRRLDFAGWVYLHSAGCISASKTKPDVAVVLGPPLDRFTLPEPPSKDDLIRAVRASFNVLNVAPERIAIPLLAAVYRAALGECDFSLFLAGLTGIGKSELAALAQQHFGPGLDARHLPGSWTSTANSLEGIAFLAKDALLVVDDFNPGGGASDVAKFHRDADRLLRGQGNSAGRQRMKQDGTLRPAKPPRGLILSTGEEIPNGHSLRARTLIIEVAPNDVLWDRLSEAQRDAADGLYAQALAGFIQRIAGNFEEWRKKRHESVEKMRNSLSGVGSHARTPSLIAELLFGWNAFLKYANAVHAITDDKLQSLSSIGRQVLIDVANSQSEHHHASDPVQQFCRLLVSALASGRAHVAGHDGREPSEQPSSWGWRFSTVGVGQHEREEWKPQGHRVGWIEVGELYLDPDAAFSVVQTIAESQGRPIPLSPSTLWKRAKEHSPAVLASWDEGQNRNTVRRSLDGMRRYVIHLRRDVLSPQKSEPSEPSEPEAERPTVAQLAHLAQFPEQIEHPKTNLFSDDGDVLSEAAFDEIDKAFQ